MMRPNQHCKYPGNHPAGVLDETALADWLAGRAKDWGAPQLAQASAIIRALTKPASAPAKTADEAVQHLIDICCTIGVDTIPAAGSGYGLVKEMLLVDLDIAQAAVQLALKSTTTKD
jgi:hypothetical protein